MTEANPSRQQDRDALLPRLKVIEDQPLESRASSYEQIHDALQAELEGSESRA